MHEVPVNTKQNQDRSIIHSLVPASKKTNFLDWNPAHTGHKRVIL